MCLGCLLRRRRTSIPLHFSVTSLVLKQPVLLLLFTSKKEETRNHFAPALFCIRCDVPLQNIDLCCCRCPCPQRRRSDNISHGIKPMNRAHCSLPGCWFMMIVIVMFGRYEDGECNVREKSVSFFGALASIRQADTR